MNFLGQLLGRATNTIHNDIVAPINRVQTAINPQHGLPTFHPNPDQIPYDQRNQYLPPQQVGESRTTDLRPQQPFLNRLVGAANRDIVQPISNAVTGTPPLLTPQQETQRILDIATKQYGITPQFQNDIKAQDPRFLDPNNPANKTVPGDDSVLHGFAGYYREGSARFKNEPSIFISNKGTDQQKAQELVHEGLHAEWAKMSPQQKQQFAQTAQATLPAAQPAQYINIPTQSEPTRLIPPGDPRGYLDAMIGTGYEFQSGSLNGFKDIPSLPDHAINEAHSYLPAQFYGANSPPEALAQQYKNLLYANYEPSIQQRRAQSSKALLQLLKPRSK